MNDPVKKSVAMAERKGAKAGVTPSKLRAKEEEPAAERMAAAAAPTAPVPDAKSLIPSAALIGVGLLLESELLVGVALGTGIMIASRWLPQAVGDTVQPIVDSTVNACYSAAAKTSEMLSDAAQRVESILTRQAAPEEEASAPVESERGTREEQAQA
ncbi:MAG TPA: hypothetical protein VEC38_08655 [Candidatus Binataceae bacterium]|nr:hypothetical protein [Candidatus Binataceae bacterium]